MKNISYIFSFDLDFEEVGAKFYRRENHSWWEDQHFERRHMQTIRKCQRNGLTSDFEQVYWRLTHTSHSEHQDPGAAEMLFSLARWARFSHCHRSALNYLTGPLYGDEQTTCPVSLWAIWIKYKTTNINHLKRKHNSRARCGGTDLKSQEVKTTWDSVSLSHAWPMSTSVYS